jgi:hypothetical protein
VTTFSRPLVTVVVPVFNAESYISACLESLRQQTLTSLEVVVVDDSSTDNSAQLADEYFAKHPDLAGRVIRLTSNVGVSDARNAGIAEAAGRYVGFVDPDDLVDSRMYQVLAAAAESEDADAAACGARIVGGRSGERLGQTTSPETVTGTEAFSRMCAGRLPSSVCFMVFSAEAIGEVKFSSGYRFEDFIFLAEVLPTFRRVHLVPDAMYEYHRREGSETGMLRPTVLHLFKGRDVAVRSMARHLSGADADHLEPRLTLRLSRTVFHQAFAFPDDAALAREVMDEADRYVTWRRIKTCAVGGDLPLALTCAALKIAPWAYAFAFRVRRAAHRMPRVSATRRPS